MRIKFESFKSNMIFFKSWLEQINLCTLSLSYLIESKLITLLKMNF